MGEHFGKGMSRETNMKPQKLFPFLETMEKHRLKSGAKDWET